VWCHRDHELKALWEWLQATQRKLAVLGILGPLPPEEVKTKADGVVHEVPRTDAVELNPEHDMGWYHQSVAFMVL
jgi:hypothetical protein